MQDGKKSKCSVISSLPCHVDRASKVTSAYNSSYGQGPKFKLFKGVVKISHKPTGSRLLLAQNNSHTQVAHLGEAYSEPFLLLDP